MKSQIVALSAMVFSSQATAQSLEYSPQDLADQAALAAKLAEQGATFEILQQPLQRSTGTVPPPNLQDLASVQRVLANTVEHRDPARTSETREFDPSIYADDRRHCDPKAPQFSWAELGHVEKSDPTDGQGLCGSCWAFASAAAVEAGISIREQQRVDIAEQDVLNCSKGGTCDGGWWHDAFGVMSGETTYTQRPDAGALPDVDVSYIAKKNDCLAERSGQYEIANWDYVGNGDSIAPVKDIKKALCERGPLVTAVMATPLWSWYKSGIYNEGQTGPSNSVNHAVLIYGWNNDGEYWLIKNSWGPQWGEQGTMRLSWSSNNTGFATAWVEPSFTQPALAENEAVKAYLPTLQTHIEEALQVKQAVQQDLSKVIESMAERLK